MKTFYAGIRLELEAASLEAAEELVNELADNCTNYVAVVEAYQDEGPEESEQ